MSNSLIFISCTNSSQKVDCFKPLKQLNKRYKYELKLYNDVKASYVGGLSKEKLPSIIEFQKTADSLISLVDDFERSVLGYYQLDSLAINNLNAVQVTSLNSCNKQVSDFFENQGDTLILKKFYERIFSLQEELKHQVKKQGYKGYTEPLILWEEQNGVTVLSAENNLKLKSISISELLNLTYTWRIEILHSKRTFLNLSLNQKTC